VSCAGSTFCVAVDNAGNALIYNGGSWSAPTLIDGSNTLESVSCASSSFCVAVDNKGNALTYNGTSWSAAKSIDSTRKLLAVSCSTTSFCAAVDAQDNALTYNGASWSAAKSIEADDTLVALSCASSSFCVAVDNAGHVITYNGTSWSAPASIDGDNTLESVSCVSSSFCVAVDNDGNALTYNGTSWSAPTSIDGNNNLDSVSCTGSSFCTAVDAKGNVVTYNGTSWSDTASVDSTRKITSISCPTATFCTAVDSKGYVTIYGLVPASAPSQFIWDTNGSLPLVLSDGINDYIYGDGTTPVEQVSLTSSTPSFMTYTPSDSSWLITNAVGDEIAFYGYDAFGNLAFGIPGSLFGYAGEYTDPSTGFSNLRARWYSPLTGTFTTRDPAFTSTNTAYAYAGDDPVNNTDPSGLSVNLQGAASWAKANAGSGNPQSFKDDCTDFVSRALYFGGGDQMNLGWDAPWDKTDPDYWYDGTFSWFGGIYQRQVSSDSWGFALDLAKHFQNNGSQFLVSGLDLKSADLSSNCSDSGLDLPSDVQPGDVVFADWSSAMFDGNGFTTGISHAGMLVNNDGQLEIAQHTQDRIDTFADWQNGGPDTHIWIVAPAPR
jgi:RHS repeat-associated protein